MTTVPATIVGISGKIGSGKTTAVKLISQDLCSDMGYKCINFARKVKEVVATLTNTTVQFNESREGKAYVPPAFAPLSLGKMQQLVGEGLRNILGDDVWIKACFQQLKPDGCYIVGDTRYKNEAHTIENVLKGSMIRLEGDPAGVRSANIDGRDLDHSSETDLDDYPFKHIIKNDGTLEDFKERLACTMLNTLFDE
jgi:hypothetical protein